MHAMKNALRALECCLLFFFLPTLYLLDLMPRWLNPLLLMLVVTIICAAVLLRDTRFDRKQLWNTDALRQRAKKTVLFFIAGGLLIGLYVGLYEPELFLNFIRRYPLMWAAVMLLYPAVSVYPQELVYRAFFFTATRRFCLTEGL